MRDVAAAGTKMMGMRDSDHGISMLSTANVCWWIHMRCPYREIGGLVGAVVVLEGDAAGAFLDPRSGGTMTD